MLVEYHALYSDTEDDTFLTVLFVNKYFYAQIITQSCVDSASKLVEQSNLF